MEEDHINIRRRFSQMNLGLTNSAKLLHPCSLCHVLTLHNTRQISVSVQGKLIEMMLKGHNIHNSLIVRYLDIESEYRKFSQFKIADELTVSKGFDNFLIIFPCHLIFLSVSYEYS